MPDNLKLTFSTGALSNLPSTYKAGQVLFAIDSNNKGYIYFDKNSSTRILMSSDALYAETANKDTKGNVIASTYLTNLEGIKNDTETAYIIKGIKNDGSAPFNTNAIVPITLLSSGNKTGTKLFLVGTTSQSTKGIEGYSNTNVFINTSNQLESTSGFKGNLIGNADTATNVAWTGVTNKPRNVTNVENWKGTIYVVKGTQTATTGNWEGRLDELPNKDSMYDGLSILYYLPRTGSGNASLRLTFADGSVSDYIPVYYTGASRATTHYAAGSTIRLTYWSAGSISVNGTPTSEARWTAADYNTNDNTVPSAQCVTAAATAAKAATCTYWVATPNSYIHVNIRYANTSANALTLNINSTGAKPIYINDIKTSSTYNNLPAGSYIAFYDGTNYYFRTDGQLPADISGTAAIATKATYDSAGQQINTTYIKNIVTDTANHKLTFTIGAGSDINQELNFVRLSGDTMTGDLNAIDTSTGPRAITTQNNNGKVGIYSYTNYGLYDFTNSKWIIHRNVSSNQIRITNNSSVWNFNSDGTLQTPNGATESVNLIGTASRAAGDLKGNAILNYVHDISISGKNITVTDGAGNSTVLVTQDNNTDTKVNVKLRGTTKSYLLATSTQPTATNQAVESLAETAVYLDAAGTLNATTFKGSLAWSYITSKPQLVEGFEGSAQADGYKLQLFNLSGGPITASNDALNGVVTIPLASNTSVGLVSTDDQTFKGVKRFEDGINVEDLVPIETHTYTNVIGTVNDNAGAGFFYAKVHGASYNGIWHVKVRVKATVPGNETYETLSYFDLWGTANTYIAYKCQNAIKNTSYRPVYYHSYYRINQTGYNNGMGGWLGFNLRYSTNPTNTSYKRTIVVDLLQYENCDIEFVNTLITPANIPNVSTSGYYNSTTTSFDNFDCCNNGLRETGEENDTTTIVSYYDRITAGVGGLSRYSLAMRDITGRWQSFTTGTGSNSSTTKPKNTAKFIMGDIIYLNMSGDIASGSIVGNGVVRHYSSLIDYRYSTNAASAQLTANQPLYIVGTVDSEGLFSLADTWWTQTLPTSEDGKVYIYIGIVYADSSTYRCDFSGWHTPLMYKNGKLIAYNDTDISHTSGTLTVPRGGTGQTSFTSGNLLVGNGTGALTTIAKTSNNTANTVVQRDSSGGFSAGTITANLNGTAENAKKDESGNNIKTYYAHELTGSHNTTNKDNYILSLKNSNGVALSDVTLPLATTEQAGLMSKTAQTFAGTKTFNNGIEIYGTIAGDASTTTGHGLWSGGGYHNAHNSIILHGDAAGVSGIAFVSSKGTLGTDLANVNAPSDRAFIQFHAYGITTATAENTAPTLATSGELNRLVIGVGNDTTDQVWLQTPDSQGLKHQVGANTYTIVTSGNYTTIIPYVDKMDSWTNGTTAGPIPKFHTITGGTWNGLAIPAANGTTASGIVTTTTQTFAGAKTFSTSISTPTLTVTGVSGFNYTGIETGNSSGARPIWFAYLGTNGKPVINTNFTYNPSGGEVKAGKFTASGTMSATEIVLTSGNDSLHSTEDASLKVTGGASISARLSVQKLRIDNNVTDTTKGFNLIYNSTEQCLEFQFGN